MKYTEATGRMNGFRQKIMEIRGEIRKIQTEIEPQQVNDYTFKTPDGETSLAALFGGKDDLFVIHNMGASCPYCTLWADGYNGVYNHLANRAAFVVISPDAPQTQQKFAAGRGWKFPMASHQGTSFAADMGYRSESGGWLPGISVFQRRNGNIFRVSDLPEGPGDDFCSVWHLFGLLPEGANGWQPRFTYP